MTIYYEDIAVDDELPTIERTPTEDAAIDFFGRDNPTNPAFRDAEVGRKQGFGGALVPGNLKIAWLTQFVSSWAGPEASVRNLRVAFRRPDIAGRPLTLAGRVVDKRQEDGRNVIELEVVTLAEGEPSVRANVQVDVPSRG
ncbi:MAG: MaoC family dehydratase [Dehalococcoidia bacterium]|nr:MaoC family dehydratase [Dehalococcoidia bacterium]MCA9844400.1 MaoC family dehydratase [Dehalococcoidia bacterium]MCA9854025.1 MaoC family dehydratase [Dehalococcoidia bacterium]